MGAADVAAAGGALAAYGIGLVALSFVKVLAPAYFSRQDTRTPVRVGMVAVAVNVLLNLVFIGPLAHVGLALATSIAAVVNAALLLRGLLATGCYQPGGGWPRLLAAIFVASLVMSGLLWTLTPAAALWSGFDVLGRGARLAGLIATGAATYLVVLRLFGIRPLRYLTV